MSACPLHLNPCPVNPVAVRPCLLCDGLWFVLFALICAFVREWYPSQSLLKLEIDTRSRFQAVCQQHLNNEQETGFGLVTPAWGCPVWSKTCRTCAWESAPVRARVHPSSHTGTSSRSCGRPPGVLRLEGERYHKCRRPKRARCWIRLSALH